MTTRTGHISPCFPTWIMLSLLLTFGLGACDNTVEPIVENETDFFAVYGFLDTDADTQFVRVSAVRPTLEPGPGSVQAIVESFVLSTGNRVRWQDSLVRLDDGQPGVLFYAPMQVHPGEIHRMEIRRTDNATTRAVASVPSRILLDVAPMQEDFNQRFVQRVTLLDQRRLPHSLHIRYRVSLPNAAEPETIVLPFFTSFNATSRGIELIVHLENDREEVLRRLDLPPFDSTLVLHSVGLEIEQLSEEWDTPETALNIEHGFGFFGARARSIERWTLPDTTLLRLGYTPPPS